jgi:hypothetical protein
MGDGFKITARSTRPTTTLTPYMGKNPIQVYSGDGVTVVQTSDGTPALLKVANAPHNPGGVAIIDPLRVAFHHGMSAVDLNPSRGALGTLQLPLHPVDTLAQRVKEVTLPFGPSPRGDISLAHSYPSDKDLRTLPFICLTTDLDYDRRSFINKLIDRTSLLLAGADNTRIHATAVTSLLNPRTNPAHFAFLPSSRLRYLRMATTSMGLALGANPNVRVLRANPALRFRPISDSVYMDTIFAADINGAITGPNSTPKMAQVFYFKTSRVLAIVEMKTKAAVPDTLRKLIISYGIPTKLISDSAAEATGEQVNAVCRLYMIDQHATEARHQNQNRVESMMSFVKRGTLRILTNSGAPSSEWFHAAKYLIAAHNVCPHPKLNNRAPIEALKHETPDVSHFERFEFYEPIEALVHTASFPNTRWASGRYLGPVEDVGNFLSSYMRLDATKTIVCRSELRRPNSRTARIAETLSPPRRPVNNEEDEDDTSDSEPPQETTTIALPVKPHGYGINQHVQADTATMPAADMEAAEARSGTLRPIPLPPPPVRRQQTGRGSRTTAADLVSMPPTPPTRPPPPESPPPPPALDEPIYEETLTFGSSGSDDDEQESSGRRGTTHKQASTLESIDPYLSSDAPLSLITSHILTKHPDTGQLEVLYRALLVDQSEAGEVMRTRHQIVGNAGNERLLQKYIMSTFTSNPNRSSWPQPNMVTVKTSRSARYADFQWAKARAAIQRRTTHTAASTTTPSPNPLSINTIQANAGFRAHDGVINRPPVSLRTVNGGGTTDEFPNPIILYGARVPRCLAEANHLDELYDGNIDLSTSVGGQRWRDCVSKQMAEFKDSNAFDIKGREVTARQLKTAGYQYLSITYVYTIKPDGTFKIRFCAGGHRIVAADQTFSSTVTTDVITLLRVHAANNGMQERSGDIRNAYMLAEAIEKTYIRCGPEFGDDEGCLATVEKALYGLPGSGHAYAQHIAEIMRTLGFTAAIADSNVWMRLDSDGKLYTYVTFYVDDYTIFSRNPDEVKAEFDNEFVSKAYGETSLYTGADHVTFNNVTYICMRTYIAELKARFSGAIPQTILNARITVPMDPNYEPELSVEQLLRPPGKAMFLQVIGSLTWARARNRSDIAYALSRINQFAKDPREDHMDAAWRILVYLFRTPDRGIKIDPLPLFDDDLLRRELSEETVMGGVPVSQKARQVMLQQDELRKQYTDAEEHRNPYDPAPLGKQLRLTVVYDASHADETHQRRSHTGVLAFAGSTVITAVSKRQKGIPTTSSHGSETLSARDGTEIALHLRALTRGLGITPASPTAFFGDNMGVHQSSTLLSSVCKKKHMALGFHVIRSAIAAGAIEHAWLPGIKNPSNALTKPLAATQFNREIQSFMILVPKPPAPKDTLTTRINGVLSHDIVTT